MRVRIGSTDRLIELFRAKPEDLVSKFGARRLDDGRYMMPIDRVPWMTIVRLTKEYPLVLNNLVLSVNNVKLSQTDIPVNAEIVMGFLVPEGEDRFLILGHIVTSRNVMFRCREGIVRTPIDLQGVPSLILTPSVAYVCSEVRAKSEMSIRVPAECLKMLNVDVHNMRTSCLAMCINLVSMLDWIEVDLSNAEITYEQL